MADQHCANCVNPGDKQTHTPKGSLQQVAGVECYVTGSNPDHAILYVTDVYGHKFLNHQKAADGYADAGFTVYIPKVLNDDMDAADPNALSKFMEWLGRNPVDHASQVADKVATELNTKYKSVQGAGFCYGARMIVNLIISKKLKAAVLNHPTFLAAEDVPKIESPLLFNCAERDSIFVPELRKKFEEGLKPKGLAVFNDYANTDHGFTVRPVGEDGFKRAAEAHAAAANFYKQKA